MTNDQIKDKVNSAITNSGLTITELAERSGVSRRTIYHLLDGDPTTVENLRKVCEVLNLELKIKWKES